MKKSLLIIFVIFTSCSSKQQITLETNKDFTYKVSERILIVFKGHTHLIYYYKDLTEHLKREFKKQNILVDFNYNLSAENPFQIDLENIPKEKYNYNEYNSFCTLEVTYPFISNGFSTRKIYDLNFNLKSSKTLKIKLKGKLRLKHGKTILTPSKQASKKLVNLIIN